MVYKVGEYIRKKGKEVIGWDEILEGGKLSGDEIVMYWRGLEGKMPEIQKAAQDGFKIISCPIILIIIIKGQIHKKHISMNRFLKALQHRLLPIMLEYKLISGLT